MAAGKNIANLSTVMQVNSSSTLASINNTFVTCKFDKLIEYINNNLAEKTISYVKYQNAVSCISTNSDYIEDAFLSCNNNYKQIYDDSHIAEIDEKIANINKYTDELYAIVNKVVPMQDQTVAYMELVKHLEETYKLKDFTNLVDTENGLIKQCNEYLNIVTNDISEKNKQLTENYNAVSKIKSNGNINTLSTNIEKISTDYNDLIEKINKFKISSDYLCVYYNEISDSIKEYDNNISAVSIDLKLCCYIFDQKKIYFKNASINNNLSLYVDSISDISSLSLIFNDISKLSADTEQPIAQISVIYN